MLEHPVSFVASKYRQHGSNQSFRKQIYSLILTLAQKESSGTFFGCRLHFEEILWRRMSPNRPIQVSITDQKLCEFSLSIIVCNIRCFRSAPWCHVAVILMDSHMLANCALPIVATESRERCLETGEKFKSLCISDLCSNSRAYVRT